MGNTLPMDVSMTRHSRRMEEHEKEPAADADPWLKRHRAHQHAVNEAFVAKEMEAVYMDRIERCRLIEGVNSHEKCRPLVEEYLTNFGWKGLRERGFFRIEDDPFRNRDAAAVAPAGSQETD